METKTKLLYAMIASLIVGLGLIIPGLVLALRDEDGDDSTPVVPDVVPTELPTERPPDTDDLPNPLIGWYGCAAKLTPAQRNCEGPPGRNAMMAFYGFSDAEAQLAACGEPKEGLVNFFVVGGAGGSSPNPNDEGYDPGYISPKQLATYTVAFFKKIKDLGWEGVLIDAEVGGAGTGTEDLTPDTFDAFFQRARQGGMEFIGVTTSHVAPYGFPAIEWNGQPPSIDGWSDYWANSPFVNFFSPQLYSNGDALDAKFYSDYQKQIVHTCAARVVVSIPDPADMDVLEKDPDWQGVSTGYIVWYNWEGAETTPTVVAPAGYHRVQRRR